MYSLVSAPVLGFCPSQHGDDAASCVFGDTGYIDDSVRGLDELPPERGRRAAQANGAIGLPFPLRDTSVRVHERPRADERAVGVVRRKRGACGLGREAAGEDQGDSGCGEDRGCRSPLASAGPEWRQERSAAELTFSARRRS